MNDFKVSAVVLTKNEEKNIIDCIESMKLFDEVIIVDDYSEDRTEEIVKNIKSVNIKYFKRKLDNNFSDQRNFGLSKAKNEWVLFLDADERITDQLLNDIKTIDTSYSAYLIRRMDVMWGRVLKHGETGNIKFVRLAKKTNSKWVGRVHEQWNVKGEIGTIGGAIMHFPHQTIREFVSEIDFYSTLRAKALHEKGKRVNLFEIIAYPKGKFVLNYLLKLGFLDGIPGFTMATMMSLHSFLVRAKLWQYSNHL